MFVALELTGSFSSPQTRFSSQTGESVVAVVTRSTFRATSAGPARESIGSSVAW